MYVHLYKYLCHCPNKFGSGNTAQTQAFHLLLFYPQSSIRMHKKLDKSYGYISTKLLIYLFIYLFIFSVTSMIMCRWVISIFLKEVGYMKIFHKQTFF